MAIKFIKQDAGTLRDAYNERKSEYDALRAAGKWSGAISHAGILLELALKLSICKHLGASQLPTMFQIHDLELLLYCSGLRNSFLSNPILQHNFKIVDSCWSIDLRYHGAMNTQADSDLVDEALFNPSNRVLTLLISIFVRRTMTMLRLLEKIRTAIQEWAQQHSVELALVEVNPSGIGSNVHIILAARKGFENWPQIEREESLYQHLRSRLGDADVVNISLTITMTEEEYDSYVRVEVK